MAETLEKQLDVLENPVDVLEKQVDVLEKPVDVLEKPVDVLENPVDVLETLENPQPKKKGRPAGAKSSVQGKPRPKRVAANRIRKESTREPDDPDEPDRQGDGDDGLPPPLPNSRRIPQVSHDDSSALMLTLLRRQAAARRQRKVDVWKSWFN
jgi:hypothetical protein